MQNPAGGGKEQLEDLNFPEIKQQKVGSGKFKDFFDLDSGE